MSEKMRRGWVPYPTWQMATPSWFVVCPLGAYSTASWGQEPSGQHCIGYVGVQQWVQSMEEKVKFTLFGEEVSKTQEELSRFQRLIEDQKLKQIRLPVQMQQFLVNFDVLNACLHFIIAVEKNLPASSFRQKCMQQISSYYIQNKMNFQIYEYGYLCACILSVPLQKTTHLIYYLLYGRLASKPYIDNLLSQKHQRRRNLRKQTLKSENENQSLRSRSVDSRHFTVFVENRQLEVEVFSKELKKLLSNEHNPMSKAKKTDNKRYFNVRKVYPDQEDALSLADEDFPEPQERHPMTIPLKVGPHDHSSVISQLKIDSSTTEQPQKHLQKKLQLRRQKFDQAFDVHRKYEKSSEERLEGPGAGGGAGKGIQEGGKSSGSSAYRIQKHPYQYFRLMASDIKTKNKELDFIRSTCTQSLNKNNRAEAKEQNPVGFRMFAEAMPESSTHRDCLRVLRTQQENLSQSQVKVSQKLVREEDQGGEGSPSLVTRKTSQLRADQRLLLFSKKMKNKFKVQKYKEQYRQFLKTQMFERVRNIC